MSSFTRLPALPVVALCLLLAGCASDDGYGGYGGNTTVAVGYGYDYYPGGYYPYYPPGYGCCWDGDVDRPDRPDRPDGPTTLPGHPDQLPAARPDRPTTQPAQRPAHQPSARPAPRPTPAPRPMRSGGGRRR
jgi:hypothetical protein